MLRSSLFTINAPETGVLRGYVVVFDPEKRLIRKQIPPGD